MAANLPNSTNSKITAYASANLNSNNTSVSVPSATGDSQRRGGGSGNFGFGATTRVPQAAPRNKQGNRSQHGNKHSRRYRFPDEDAFAESAAMNSTSSRKGQTSITHLMNFSLPPRPFRTQQNQQNRNNRRNPAWGQGSGYHAVDKARYVHANYRFIVDPRQDYTAQSVDADVYLDWSHVLQILASPQSQDAACPICLGEPAAPRMAKCGHVFCLHCLIRYMHSTSESDQHAEKRPRWKKCPICWDSIYITDTRPVRWYIGQEGLTPREGTDIFLRLVMRPVGSTLALPKDADTVSRTDAIPWHFAADVMDYARVMKGSKDYMMSQYQSEIQQLEQIERHDELMFGEGSEWTQRAVRAIKDAQKRLIEAIFSSHDDIKSPTGPLESVIKLPSHSSAVNDSDINTSSSSTLVSNPHGSNVSTLSLTLANSRADSGNSTGQTDYFFYQALLHYYLAPLDIRILKVAFGDFCAFPSTILPRVERISHGHIVDEDLRKRAKYLAHLPYGCEVSFLECDWTDIVPASVLEHFRTDIDKRRKRNSEKDARDEKNRIRAEREEDDKRWAVVRQRRSPSPPQHFRPDDFQPLVSSDDLSVPGSLTVTGTESTSPIWTSRRPQHGSAFASLASPSTSLNAGRTVWGTMAVQSTSPVLSAAIPDDLVEPDDGWLQGWEKDLLHHEVDLVAQLDATSPIGESSRAAASSNRKKKGKKITLMSTNVRRGA